MVIRSKKIRQTAPWAACLMVLAWVFSANAAVPTRLTVETQPNLLANGDFASQGDGVPENWTFSGKPPQIERIAAATPLGKPTLRITTTGVAVTEVSQTISVPASTTFLFRLPLRTAALAEVVIGRRRMAYTGEGEWQTVADLVKTDRETSLTVTLRLRAVTGSAENVFDLGAAQLIPASLPDLPVRRVKDATTPLVAASVANAYIIYPSGQKGYAELAAQVQDAVRAASGVTLPIVSDREATQSNAPVLLAPYRDAHLILLGRLGINRALWSAYNRFLGAVDGYYPGGDGYVVRTAANVMRNGKNHIILGGSSDAGAARAVDRFCARLHALGDGNKTLTIPWLLEVELGGDCCVAFDADDKLWTENPDNPELPEPSPGYRTLIRWYMNAMGYYWSGRESYRNRAVSMFLPVLEDRAYTHHYIVEFFVRTYDMLDDSGIFTPEQTAAADALILKNFWEFFTGPDIGWLTLFSPPYENIGVRNRHSIAPWMGDLVMADFLNDYFKLQGNLADVVTYRRAEKHPLFRHIAAERWQSSLPDLNESHDDEITAIFFRYALDHERYDFFETGNARRALKIESLTTERATASDDHFVLGILANYYADGRYKKLLETTPGPQRLFQNRYICGVHRYWPGSELLSTDLVGLSGVRIPPLQPHDSKHLRSMSFSTHRNPAVDPAEFFECVVFRDGFEPHSDLLKVSGFNYNNGALTDFLSHGQRILAPVKGSAYGPLPDVYFNLNALSVVRTDRWIEDTKPYAGAARREWLAGFPSPGGGVAFTVDPFITTSWRREVLWLEKGLFVVRDAVTALEDGTYSLSIGWFPNGAPEWKDGSWTGVLPGVRYRITPLSTDFSRDTDSKSLRQVLAATLKQGQTVNATMVLEVVPTGQSFRTASLSGTGTLRLSKIAEEGSEPLIVRWGGVADALLETDAAVTVLRPQRVELMQATFARMAGVELLRQKAGASLRLDLKTGQTWIGEEEAASHADQIASLRDAAQALLTKGSKPTAAQGVAAPKSVASQRLEPKDGTAAWRRTWSYTGLQRPRLITTGCNLAGDIYDLGREYRLGEIRALLTGSIWEPTALPPLETAPDGSDRIWTPLPQGAVWHAGVKTGNYGEATPQAETFQVLYPKDLRVRYLRGPGAGMLLYYDADALAQRSPLKLEAEDMNGDGQAEILAAPDIWAPFLRNRMKEDTLLALLNTDGTERFQRTFEQNIQQVRLLRSTQGGAADLYVLTQDTRLRIFDGAGKLKREDDLYAMHEDFNRTSGHPNTRQPAGGFTLPFSVGLWRPDAQGRRQTIVSRYGAYSFLDPEGRFEGLLTVGDYVLARLLPYGVDFDGDGREEQLCLGKWGLTHLDGDASAYIAEPDGAKFFPQIYKARVIPGKGGGGHVDGTPIRLFEVVPFGSIQGRPRYVLVVRESVVALYDPIARKAVFAWTPAVSIRAAAVSQTTDDRLVLAVSTDDNLLWELSWQNGEAAALSSFQAISFPDQINALVGVPDRVLWIGADGGLYRLEDFRNLTRVDAGAYQALCPLPGAPAALVAATAEGEIVRFDARAAD